MRQIVRNTFINVNLPHEGFAQWMYLDTKGLVTTGVGNYLPTAEAAQAMTWRKSDGSIATPDEVSAEWTRVKEMGYPKEGRPTYTDPSTGRVYDQCVRFGGGWFQGQTSLRLDKAEVYRIAERQLIQNDGYLQTRYPEFERWPADAQLAAHSMSWALGAAFGEKFKKLDAALKRNDFLTASTESKMQELGNEGVIRRNAMNKTLFENAAEVIRRNLNYDAINLKSLTGKGSPSADSLPVPPGGSQDSVSGTDISVNESASALITYLITMAINLPNSTRTRMLTTAFQRAVGLPVDGIYGPKTANALTAHLRAQYKGE